MSKLVGGAVLTFLIACALGCREREGGVPVYLPNETAVVSCERQGKGEKTIDQAFQIRVVSAEIRSGSELFRLKPEYADDEYATRFLNGSYLLLRVAVTNEGNSQNLVVSTDDFRFVARDSSNRSLEKPGRDPFLSMILEPRELIRAEYASWGRDALFSSYIDKRSTDIICAVFRIPIPSAAAISKFSIDIFYRGEDLVIFRGSRANWLDIKSSPELRP